MNYDLFSPPCAGASLRYYEICRRCGATAVSNCGDAPAYQAQITLRNWHRAFSHAEPVTPEARS